MKIVDMRKKRMTRFDSLDIGVVFIKNVDGEEYMQMKIRQVVDVDEDIYNAVSLSTGEPYYIKPDLLVEIVDTELHIV